MPGISRVLVLSYLADPIAPPQVKSLEKAARSLGVTLQIQDIKTADDLPAAFEAGARERVDGLIITAESIFIAHRARVSELAASHRLPAMYPYTNPQGVLTRSGFPNHLQNVSRWQTEGRLPWGEALWCGRTIRAVMFGGLRSG